MTRLTVILCSIMMALAAIAAPKATEEDEILFISSYNADTFYANEFTNDFINAYTKVGGKCHLSIEMMNCSSLDQHELWMPAMKEILKKHENAKMIILYGGEAWACYLSLTEEKWRKVPICLVASQIYGACMEFNDIPSIHRNDDNRSMIINFSECMEGFNVKMCYYYEYGIIEDIQVIKHLDEKINTIAVVGDNSYSGYSMLRYSVEMLKKNYPKLNIIEIDGIREASQSAQEIVKNLSSNAAIVYCVWRYDRNGTFSLNLDRQIFGSRDDIPVLSLTGRGFDSWTLGGSNPHYDWYDGRMHPSLLTYELVDQGMDIEPYFYKCHNFYQFDLKLMTKYGYDQDLLPDGAMLINSKMSLSNLYDMYKSEIILSIALIAVLLLTIGILSVYSVRMSKMRKSLQASAEQLKVDKKLLEENEHNLIIARDNAETSDRMKTHFIHNISHEIRTPLNAIQGFSQIMLDPSLTLDDEAKANLSQRIWSNVEQVTTIVDDILEYSELEGDEYVINKSSICVEELCSDLQPVVSSHLKDKVNYECQINLPGGFEINTDVKLVKDVLLQFLKNACKFTTSGFIRLSSSLSEDKSCIKFEVKDTGPGVPASQATYIFERFKKLNDFAQGTGLGLSICKKIATKLSGEVYLDTTYKEGANFVFTIPIN
ncbi:MAG: ATP-binding protein [Bacteroidales bacterium]|nr:ATP-binding protein [Bacteroidales bacterium]